MRPHYLWTSGDWFIHLLCCRLEIVLIDQPLHQVHSATQGRCMQQGHLHKHRCSKMWSQNCCAHERDGYVCHQTYITITEYCGATFLLHQVPYHLLVASLGSTKHSSQFVLPTHTHKHIQTKKTQISNAILISKFLPKSNQLLAAYIDSAHLLRPVWRAVIWLNQHLHHFCMSVVRRKMQSVPAILHKARYQIPSKVCILWSSLLYPANFKRLPMKVGHVVLCNRKHRANARGIHLCPS